MTTQITLTKITTHYNFNLLEGGFQFVHYHWMRGLKVGSGSYVHCHVSFAPLSDFRYIIKLLLRKMCHVQREYLKYTHIYLIMIFICSTINILLW